MSEFSKRRSALRRAAFLVLLAALSFGAYQALFNPKTPLPTAWNPVAPLNVADNVTPLTLWKLRRAQSDPVACLTALATGADGQMLPPLEVSGDCHIMNRVRLTLVGQSQIQPIETACSTALRLTMWERHGLQPAAQAIMGSGLSELRHIGSYNCRQIRTPSGSAPRMSTHATAEAIDITGFVFNDGQRVTLLDDWQGNDAGAAFLRAARDSACKWFATTLGPDFNSLHADHFHLQARGWGTCR